MQELQQLRKELRKVHGSIGRVADKSGYSEELVRKVFQGNHTNQKVVDAALLVHEENKQILAAREFAKKTMQQQIAQALQAA